MSFGTINVGTTANDGNGDPLRTAMQTVNAALGGANAGQMQGFKNRVHNGDFSIAQRGTSFSSPADGAYTLDGVRHTSSGGMTTTISQQAFTPGQTDVLHEPTHYLRWLLSGTSSGNPWIEHRIENVRTMAGRKAVLSFWVKGSRAENVVCRIQQNFGSGGSAEVSAFSDTVAITTSWVRKSLEVDMASISGKTIGTSSYITIQLYFLSGISSITTDIADLQLEPADTDSPVASPFERLPDAIQRAWCQRYYAAKTVLTENGSRHIPLPAMRTTPTVAVSVGAASGVNEDGFDLSHSTSASSSVTASAEL